MSAEFPLLRRGARVAHTDGQVTIRYLADEITLHGAAGELFLQVPTELEEGALALGATRWEMVRGVILPATRTGIAAAIILGLGRALGEAIAVTQVIGGGTKIAHNIFGPGDTIASKIAASYQGAASGLEQSSLLYLAAILLVIGLLTNFAAQVIVRRFDPLRGAH